LSNGINYSIRILNILIPILLIYQLKKIENKNIQEYVRDLKENMVDLGEIYRAKE